MDSTETIVYRFPNATVVRVGSGVYSSRMELIDGTDKVLVKDSSPISGEITGAMHGLEFYRSIVGELAIYDVRINQSVARYVPIDWKSGLRDLTEEEYNRLTAGFRQLYKKELDEPEELRTEVPHTLVEVDVELSDDLLMGRSFISDLHGQVHKIREAERRSRSSWGRDEVRPDLSRVLPLTLKDSELISIVGDFGNRLARGDGGHGYKAKAVFRTGYREPSRLEISYFATAYRGETRKVLDKKANGKPYADGRGRMVQDLPSQVGSSVVTEGDLADWWRSIQGNSLPDSKKLEALQLFTRHIWRLS